MKLSEEQFDILMKNMTNHMLTLQSKKLISENTWTNIKLTHDYKEFIKPMCEYIITEYGKLKND